MGLRKEIDRLVGDMVRELIVSLDFKVRLWGLLCQLPFPEQYEVLDALAQHANDHVRREATDLQVWVRQREQSLDFDYVQEHSPLRPGGRLELFDARVSFDALSGTWVPLRPTPRWLNGREYYTATFLRFAQRGDNHSPVAVVEFEDRIDIPGHTGRYGILIAVSSFDSFFWGSQTGTVTVYVVEVLPNDLASVFSVRPPVTALELEAVYRLAAGSAEPAVAAS